MAEFLIYNKEHWMDALNQEQIDEYVKKYPKFMDNYNARQQKGDVIEVRPDGYWTGPKAPGYDENVFLLVSVPRLKFEDAEKYGEPLYQQFPVSVLNEETSEFEEEWKEKLIKKRKYNFSNVIDKQIFNSISEIMITEKSLG